MESINRVKEEGKRLKREVREKTVGYILGALGLVAGLAWNDAIKALIDQIFPLSKDTVIAKFVYAAIITVVIVIATVYIVRYLGKKEE